VTDYCDRCGRDISGGHTRLDDGRLVCWTCSRTIRKQGSDRPDTEAVGLDEFTG
jgi:recombinational DNA repair protein (RecF pathway)